jgi:hypothetical protein
MLNTITSAAEMRTFEKRVLDQFGKPFYETVELTEVQRRFRLTRAVLHDIMADCGVDAEPHDCLARLLNSKNTVQPPLAGRQLVRFTAVARRGRALIREHSFNPSFFVPRRTLKFARRVHGYLAQHSN